MLACSSRERSGAYQLYFLIANNRNQLYELEWNRIELEGVRLRMQCCTISSCNTPAKQGTAKTSPSCHHVWTGRCVSSSLLLCPWSHPQKSKPCQECLVCPCPVCQGIQRGKLVGQGKGLCLLLNLGLSPSRKIDRLKGSQHRSIYCHVFHQFLKGTMTPTLLSEKIMNPCIGSSFITALKLYDSKY